MNEPLEHACLSYNYLSMKVGTVIPTLLIVWPLHSRGSINICWPTGKWWRKEWEMWSKQAYCPQYLLSSSSIQPQASHKRLHPPASCGPLGCFPNSPPEPTCFVLLSLHCWLSALAPVPSLCMLGGLNSPVALLHTLPRETNPSSSGNLVSALFSVFWNLGLVPFSCSTEL